jgi:hypothetical protein
MLGTFAFYHVHPEDVVITLFFIPTYGIDCSEPRNDIDAIIRWYAMLAASQVILWLLATVAESNGRLLWCCKSRRAEGSFME